MIKLEDEGTDTKPEQHTDSLYNPDSAELHHFPHL